MLALTSLILRFSFYQVALRMIPILIPHNVVFKVLSSVTGTQQGVLAIVIIKKNSFVY